MKEDNTSERLPCGCLMFIVEDANGERAFGYEPCSLNCKYYRYVVAEAARQNKPLEILDLR